MGSAAQIVIQRRKIRMIHLLANRVQMLQSYPPYFLPLLEHVTVSKIQFHAIVHRMSMYLVRKGISVIPVNPPDFTVGPNGLLSVEEVEFPRV